MCMVTGELESGMPDLYFYQQCVPTAKPSPVLLVTRRYSIGVFNMCYAISCSLVRATRMKNN